MTGTTPPGTSPPGAGTEQAAAQWVREMFGRVAPRYDFLNHLLSFNLDKRWRARLAASVAPVLARPEPRVLDLCCGTGDVLREIVSRGDRTKKGRVFAMGADFCHPMLTAARRKVSAPVFEADALMLPLRRDSLDLVTMAFGFRNLANYEKGLEELLRILKRGGMAAILEFSQPVNRPFAALYDFFSKYVLPRVGGFISGSPEAYSYLPESIRKFPSAEELAVRLREAGFARVEFERLTGGLVVLHRAWK
jgi:demethylmenaquinone methyltransferase / 2-methoxy-6-polyprenyl-1,4-benzoquinol methylase